MDPFQIVSSVYFALSLPIVYAWLKNTIQSLRLKKMLWDVHMARQRKLCAMKEHESADEKADNGSDRSSYDDSEEDEFSGDSGEDEQTNKKERLTVYRKQDAYSSEEDEVD